MDDRTFEDEMLPDLLEAGRMPLDPNEVAAYVDGALEGEERRNFEARLRGDPEARALVAALRPRRTARRTLLLGAAAVAAVVVLAIALVPRGDDEPETPPTLEVRLAAAMTRARAAAPELLRDFALVPADALRTEPPAMRGALRWLGPRGVLLEAPTTLRWQAPAGADRVALALRGLEFRWEREAAGTAVAAPALAPGVYVVTLRSLDLLAGQPVRSRFEILDLREAARHRRALAVLAEADGDGVGRLLGVHYALQEQLFAEARRRASSLAERDDEVGAEARALRRHVEALIGSP